MEKESPEATQEDSFAEKGRNGRRPKGERLVISLIVMAACAAGSASALVLSCVPSEPERLLHHVEAEMERGDFQAVISSIRKLIADFPSSREAAKARGLYPGVLLEKLRREVEKDDYCALQSALAIRASLLDNFPESDEAEGAEELSKHLSKSCLPSAWRCCGPSCRGR